MYYHTIFFSVPLMFSIQLFKRKLKIGQSMKSMLLSGSKLFCALLSHCHILLFLHSHQCPLLFWCIILYIHIYIYLSLQYQFGRLLQLSRLLHVLKFYFNQLKAYIWYEFWFISSPSDADLNTATVDIIMQEEDSSVVSSSR